jgi:hypothetical protein
MFVLVATLDRNRKPFSRRVREALYTGELQSLSGPWRNGESPVYGVTHWAYLPMAPPLVTFTNRLLDPDADRHRLEKLV